MQVNVSARHGSLQPGDQELLVEKTEKLRRLYDRVNAIDVTVDLKQLDQPVVEIQVSVEQADDCLATAEANTVISARFCHTQSRAAVATFERKENRAPGYRAQTH